jgi:hypothetical protein
VLPGFFIVLFVEAPHQLLKDRAHGVVVEARLSNRSVAVEDGNGLRFTAGSRNFSMSVPAHRLSKGAEPDCGIQIIEDVLYIGREAVEVGLEVGPELACARFEVAQVELGGVVEGLTGCLAQREVLARDARLIQGRLHVERGLLGRLKHGVEPAQDGHGQEHITVFAANVKITQHIVCNVPDKICETI